MKIIEAFPPNIEAIAKVFPHALKQKGVLFCYGSVIYNPTKIKVPAHNIEHERIHAAQQGGDPAGWWERYLADAEFRFDQELPAYRREYAIVAGSNPPNIRKKYLKDVAGFLSGPLYGHLLTFEKAKRLIQMPDAKAVESKTDIAA